MSNSELTIALGTYIFFCGKRSFLIHIVIYSKKKQQKNFEKAVQFLSGGKTLKNGLDDRFGMVLGFIWEGLGTIFANIDDFLDVFCYPTSNFFHA